MGHFDLLSFRYVGFFSLFIYFDSNCSCPRSRVWRCRSEHVDLWVEKEERPGHACLLMACSQLSGRRVGTTRSRDWSYQRTRSPTHFLNALPPLVAAFVLIKYVSDLWPQLPGVGLTLEDCRTSDKSSSLEVTSSQFFPQPWQHDITWPVIEHQQCEWHGGVSDYWNVLNEHSCSLVHHVTCLPWQLLLPHPS